MNVQTDTAEHLAMLSARLPTHRLRVDPSWIDDNGHMNSGYYGVAVQPAGIAAFDSWDYGVDFRQRARQSSFVGEAQIFYRRELKVHDPVFIATRILIVEQKRMQIMSEIYNEDGPFLAALVRQLVLHVDVGPPPKVRAMPDDVFARLSQLQAEHEQVALPEDTWRVYPVLK